MPRVDPLLLRRAFVAIALAVLLPLAWLGSLDNLAREHVEAGLKRALVTFATARLANAVISVLQETSVAISPMGVGVTTMPGQALDPLNDVIEQFSTLMLVASVSLGAQLVLINVGGLAAVSSVLTLVMLSWAWFAWRREAVAPRWLARALVIVLFARFAVPVAAVGSEAIFRITMSHQYAEAQGQVQATSDLIARSAPPPESAQARPEGRIERLERWFSERKRDLQVNFAELKDRAENAIRHIVTLMALFVVQTILLPIAFLWLAYRIFGATLRLR
ncbi:MAG TPA: hypothetical protein VEC19_15580 [Usitatibacter sp.]|nr:hypothetical protein [Usitatibacter sp.]